MAFTLICHACGQKVSLFDLDVKKRKGTVRCTRCGARIPYDLDKRKIQQSGFWAEETPAFDTRSRSRLIRQLEREQHRGTEPQQTPAHSFGENPFSAKAGFAKFDLKTGRIVENTPETDRSAFSSAPAARKTDSSAAAPRPRFSPAAPATGSSRKVTLHAVHASVPSVSPARSGTEVSEKKTFTPPPRIVTRTAHRNMTLVRTAQKASVPKKPVQLAAKPSLWQRIKNFFFHSR